MIKWIESKEKRFGIITSSRFNKSTAIQNKTRRVIAEALRQKIADIPDEYYYVIIPKKAFVGKDGKIKPDVKAISVEIDTFLSEMAISRSGTT